MREYIDNAAGRPVVCHLLCDDPDYIGHYARVFSEYISSTPPRVSFGPGGDEGLENSSSSASSMLRNPRPHRRTSGQTFMKDMWLLVLCETAVFSAGSSVMSLIRGWQTFLGAEFTAEAIGDWPVLQQPTKEAQGCISSLGRVIAESAFDPRDFRITHEQLNSLQVITGSHVADIDAQLQELATANITKASVVAPQLYERFPILQSCRLEFCKAHAAGGVSAAIPAHFFGAFLHHRLNPFLAQEKSPHTWVFDGQNVHRHPPISNSLAIGLTTKAAPSKRPASLSSTTGGSSSSSAKKPRIVPPPMAVQPSPVVVPPPSRLPIAP